MERKEEKKRRIRRDRMCFRWCRGGTRFTRTRAITHLTILNHRVTSRVISYISSVIFGGFELPQFVEKSIYLVNYDDYNNNKNNSNSDNKTSWEKRVIKTLTILFLFSYFYDSTDARKTNTIRNWFLVYICTTVCFLVCLSSFFSSNTTEWILITFFLFGFDVDFFFFFLGNDEFMALTHRSRADIGTNFGKEIILKGFWKSGTKFVLVLLKFDRQEMIWITWESSCEFWTGKNYFCISSNIKGGKIEFRRIIWRSPVSGDANETAGPRAHSPASLQPPLYQKRV